MDKEKIKEAVKVYLQEENSDYAIMLNGKWGSGKTYFVKNELINHIQNQDDRKVIYISLFGITTIDELYSIICLHIVNIKTNEYAEKRKAINNPILQGLNKIKSENMSIISSVLAKGLNILPKADVIKSIASEISSDRINFNNYVFIFDDLERNSLGYEQLLGFFDKIADQDKLKAILVCNEKKIKSKYYKKFKEKVVGLTIEYSTNMRFEFDDIVKLTIDNEDIRKIVIDNKSTVLKLFNSNNSNNLRTFTFVCKRFSEICMYIDSVYIKYDKNKKYFEKILMEILRLVVIKSISIKEKNTNDDINKNNGFASYEKDDKYISCEFIFEYLRNYNLDKDEVNQFLEKFVTFEDNIEKNEIITKLNNAFYLDNDTEVKKVLKEAYYGIENDKFNINVYPYILNNIFILENILYDNEIPDREDLKKYIKKNVTTRAKDYLDSIWVNHEEGDKTAIEFQKELQEIIIKENKKMEQTSFKEIFESENDCFIDKFKCYMYDKKNHMDRNGELMSLISIEAVFEKIKGLNNKQILEFYNGLSYIYQTNNSSLKEFYHSDKEFFRELKEKIESELLTEKSSKSKMQKLRLKGFCEYLDTIYNKL